YECNAAQIPLQTEVSFLQNFLQLEKLRHNENVSVRLNCPEQIPMYLGIAPFVLMTFLENAFKHVSKHSDQANWIQMEIEVQGNSLIVRVQNSFSDFAQKEAISYGGIGLQNVQRRLDLMYPDQYQLDIAANEGLFTVDLQLQLDTLTDIHPNQAAILV
ncbi:MAG: GHKL domain-containing protein, partial [Bacteroidota bacterium]